MPRITQQPQPRCCGYAMTRRAVVLVNLMYMGLGVFLIAVAAIAKGEQRVSSIAIAGGTIACGVFLMLVALLGCCGGMKQQQVMLFIYIVLMAILFILEFSISIATLAVSVSQEQSLLEKGWSAMSPNSKSDVQNALTCCGLNDANLNTTNPLGPGPYCPGDTQTQGPLCGGLLLSSLEAGRNYVGGIGLTFSFVMLVGIFLARRLRNLRNPKSDPSEFL